MLSGLLLERQSQHFADSSLKITHARKVCRRMRLPPPLASLQTLGVQKRVTLCPWVVLWACVGALFDGSNELQVGVYGTPGPGARMGAAEYL